DGKVLWQTEDHGDLAYSNLAMLDVAGTPALGAVLGMTFFVLKREDGKILHEYPWRLRGNAVHCATPIAVGDDRVFLSTAYNKGCAMLRLGTDKEPEMVWGNRRMRNKVTACVQHEGHFYGFDESMLRCIDLNGNSKWRARGLGLGSLSMAGGRLLVMNSDGELIVAEATPEEFRELSRKKVLDGGVYWTMPVLVDGLIYVRNSLGDMRCLDHRLTGAEATSTVSAPTKPAPSPEALFAHHAKLVVSDAFVQKGKALRLRGTWGIPLRGLDPEPMTLTLVAPDRWDLRLDKGGLLYTYAGNGAWAIEPQGPRTIEGDELLETKQLFPLPELFAPTCPKGAVTRPRIIRFAETQCWKVTSSAGKSFYFHSETGHLVGTEGDGISTLVFHGSQRLGGLTLPKSITRFRADDGQEHVMVLTAAKWIKPPADLFALPPAIKRIMRTPAELLRDAAALQKRFAKALGRYQAKDKSTPLRDDVVTLRVRDGELWFATP
ncbi:MAG: hypothetical protein GY944_13560, partial [bacterium]|nr:hypothetical protein [bacterium]